MLLYAHFKRNTRQGQWWEQHWYKDADQDYYLGTGYPAEVSAGPVTNKSVYMAQAFVLAASLADVEKAKADPELRRYNDLLREKNPGVGVAEESSLRRLLDERYGGGPVAQSGTTVYAVEDDEYKERAYRTQYGTDRLPGVGHTVAKTMLRAIFTDSAAAKTASIHGSRPYEVTPDASGPVRKALYLFAGGKVPPPASEAERAAATPSSNEPLVIHGEDEAASGFLDLIGTALWRLIGSGPKI